MDKTAGTLIREFEEDRPMTDHGLEIQLKGMCEKFLKENTKLHKKLHEQNLMQERIRTGVIGLIKKVEGTIYPCEYNDALADVIDLMNKLEWEKNND